jgi:hypothetical protein
MNFDFSMDGYYYFFKSLLFNDIEINRTIFGFIKNKEELRREFDNISPYFDDRIKIRFYMVYSKTIK